jgi:hypothetical protein
MADQVSQCERSKHRQIKTVEEAPIFTATHQVNVDVLAIVAAAVVAVGTAPSRGPASRSVAYLDLKALEQARRRCLHRSTA